MHINELVSIYEFIKKFTFFFKILSYEWKRIPITTIWECKSENVILMNTEYIYLNSKKIYVKFLKRKNGQLVSCKYDYLGCKYNHIMVVSLFENKIFDLT